MPYTQITAPTQEPVTILEVKDHLRLDGTDEDWYIQGLIKTARDMIESHTKRHLITQTWEYRANAFPAGVLEIQDHNPMSSVTSIVYLDSDGSSQALSTGDYNYEVVEETARVFPARSTSWPATYSYEDSRNNVRVRFVSGYGGADSVPEAIKQAIFLTIGDLYENRENIVIGRYVAKIPGTAEALLAPYTITRF